MAGKRRKVPHALHSELSEYSSLLRALSTNDTLDVAKRLTESKPRKRKKRTEEESDGAAENEGTAAPSKKRRKRTEDAPVDAESTQNEAAGSSQLPEEEPNGDKPKRVRKRDGWTRWPLLVTDLRVPEFGLDEEIEALVRHCLRNNNPHPTDEDGDSDPEDDAPAWLPHLTQSSSAFLSSLFALLAHHTPARPQVMQDRLNAIDWRMVLDILATCGSVDADVINTVKTRMEAIYGPYDGPAPTRLEARAVAKSRTDAALDEADDAMFVAVRPSKRLPKRVLEDVDSDALDD
ncbi:hypothetical protein MVEN_01774900 [Mycena venus]|uniref:Uncharacterized protein n=1 Tax=Mycena venus TaxID=2733690 RepID=A0A8H7CQ47_9AGAR|nr:hypothetical protein MVEN_01774900 [Mycena venus]